MRMLSKTFPLVLLLTSLWAQSGPSTTTGLSFTATPIMDLGTSSQNGSPGSHVTYKGFEGGLYENYSNTIPKDHAADGTKFAAEIQPLDERGNPSPLGKISLESAGMSMVQGEFGQFMMLANSNSTVDRENLLLGNGALSGEDACDWYPAQGPNCDGTNRYDQIASGLAGRGLSPLQIQVVWLKNVNGRDQPNHRGCLPQGTLCVPLCDPNVSACTNTVDSTDAVNNEMELGNILRAMKTRWPNVKLVFLSSRSWGGYSPADGPSPEPYAYESGFAVKWVIQAQINQIRTGVVDKVAGNLSYGVAPWIAWGPYLWAEGDIPRSDGLYWCDGQAGRPCYGEMDYRVDGTHVNVTGANKIANMLIKFFSTSSYTPWFKAESNPAQ